jgi:hypothetical protein
VGAVGFVNPINSKERSASHASDEFTVNRERTRAS